MSIVLVLVDRELDLAPMFLHSWIYRDLVRDHFDHRVGGRVFVDTASLDANKKQGQKRSYDLTFSSDFFWMQNAGLLFPVVAENVDTESKRCASKSSSFDDMAYLY